MEERFESSNEFYAGGIQMDAWKQAVQRTVNAIVSESLQYPLDERFPQLLTYILKKKWNDLSPLWFKNDTDYYFRLVLLSGELLPFLEKEQGALNGWLQFREFPSAWSSQHLTLPIVQTEKQWSVYLFEKNEEVISRVAKGLAATAIYSSCDSPELLHVCSVENGKRMTFRFTDKQKRMYDL
ncbi:hypothetical protein [Alteribacillus sp. HJP-4]|uniref:hypothetical protein n=1 Tax=Alteribacillus sp. HJP-4 TaxID=2775394 RepID=UPI0035CD31D1